MKFVPRITIDSAGLIENDQTVTFKYAIASIDEAGQLIKRSNQFKCKDYFNDVWGALYRKKTIQAYGFKASPTTVKGIWENRFDFLLSVPKKSGDNYDFGGNLFHNLPHLWTWEEDRGLRKTEIVSLENKGSTRNYYYVSADPKIRMRPHTISLYTFMFRCLGYKDFTSFHRADLIETFKKFKKSTGNGSTDSSTFQYYEYNDKYDELLEAPFFTCKTYENQLVDVENENFHNSTGMFNFLHTYHGSSDSRILITGPEELK